MFIVLGMKRAKVATSTDPVLRRESGKIELSNKLGAMQQLAKMCEWNELEKHEIEHGYKARQELIEVIARLRGPGAIRVARRTGRRSAPKG